MNYPLEVGEMHELLENLFSVANEFILPPPPPKKKYLAKKIFLRFSQNTTVYQEGGRVI